MTAKERRKHRQQWLDGAEDWFHRPQDAMSELPGRICILHTIKEASHL